jgi:DNA (cytosine-5)-methyltransferase 1
MTIKILNLYAGIGGNRKLWSGDIEVTAVENVPEIAKIYQNFFPNDKVIIADAHQYLLEHYKEFDFIWSSPPCPSHSRVRYMGTKAKHPTCGTIIPVVYPDMNLYQEIIFLFNYFEGKFVVENVIGYYEPLIKPQEVGKHYYWANFIIGKIKKRSRLHNATINEMQDYKGFDISKYKLEHRKDVILRNCVEPEAGLHIFNMAFKNKQEVLI